MDFLSYYGLLMDLRNKRLVDMITILSSTGYSTKADIASIKTIVGKSMYHQFLADLTHPPVF